MYPLIETRDGAGDGDVLYDCAGEALEALDTALGEGDWFFGSSEPGVLDAAVFGYVHLILDDELGNGVGGRWAETEGSIRMRVLVEACERLRAHRMRMLERCYI